MRSQLATLLVLVALAPVRSGGQTAAGPKIASPNVRKILVEPSSTSLAGGKARLNVPTLTRQPGVCVGSYQLKVTPYFFKSEKGRISITVPDQALVKLTQNTPLEFTGSDHCRDR